MELSSKHLFRGQIRRGEIDGQRVILEISTLRFTQQGIAFRLVEVSDQLIVWSDGHKNGLQPESLDRGRVLGRYAFIIGKLPKGRLPKNFGRENVLYTLALKNRKEIEKVKKEVAERVKIDPSKVRFHTWIAKNLPPEKSA